MLILGIETTCDETGIALYDFDRGLLANLVHSQISLHAPYGGVVPELASRDHIRRMPGLLKDALIAAGVDKGDLGGVAYAAGPGLIGAVLVGAATGRSLGYVLDIPTVGVNHLEAHLLSPLLEDRTIAFPFLSLIVSGGHTLLIRATSWGHYELLGESLDDAVGEAFDKVAKLLSLPYPGGPSLSKLAEQGCPGRFRFPRPMTDRPTCDFSFSGLKTHVAHVLKATDDSEQTRADIAWAFQDAAVDTLIFKCRYALEQTGLKRLIVSGGVSANAELRRRMKEVIGARSVEVYFPRLEWCTDNAAMIAHAGAWRLLRGDREGLAIRAHARWAIGI